MLPDVFLCVHLLKGTFPSPYCHLLGAQNWGVDGCCVYFNNEKHHLFIHQILKVLIEYCYPDICISLSLFIPLSFMRGKY